MGTPLTSPAPDTAQPSRQATRAGADPLVLAGRTLAPGYVLADTARYSERVWALTPALLQSQQPPSFLNFGDVPAPYVPVVKQLCWAMLSGPLPAREPRPKIMSIRRHFTELKRFIHWVAARPGRPRLSQLTCDDLAAYAVHLTSTLRGAASREVAQAAVRLLWRYRTVLDEDRLAIDPLQTEGWGGSTRRARAENTTPRIPEEVMGPLLGWCLRIIDDFGGDILAAHLQHGTRPRTSNGRALGGTGRRPQVSAGERARRLDTLLQDHLANATPLPGWRGQVNTRVLRRRLDLADYAIRWSSDEWAQIDAAVAVVGLTEAIDIPFPVTGRLDGRPWLTRLDGDQFARYGAATLARLLHGACYIVIAYLSGMRDSEIKHLRRGSIRALLDDSNCPYRWTLTGRAFKGEHDPAGAQATWVIGAPAARAVNVLEQLHPRRRGQRAESLWRGISTGRSDQAGVLSLRSTLKLINDVVCWINDYCAEHHRADAIPDIDGKRWQLSTRQFRRTLAWHIARRPGGAIAGAIQYQHLSIQMFEGYAGTSDSGFRSEVEAEQALVRAEHLLTFTQHDHATAHPPAAAHPLAGPGMPGRMGGPAAADAAARLETFAAHTTSTATPASGYAGSVVTDPHRLRRIMRRHDPHIYPGTYATCVFDADKALCRPRPDHSGTPRPSTGDYKPLECRNVALTSANTTALRAEADRLKALAAARPTLPPLLLADLTERHHKISTFLHRVTGAEQS